MKPISYLTRLPPILAIFTMLICSSCGASSRQAGLVKLEECPTYPGVDVSQIEALLKWYGSHLPIEHFHI